MKMDRVSGGFRKKRSWGSWIGYLAFLVIYTWAYMFIGSVVVLKHNTDRSSNQQSDYIDAVYQSAAISSGSLQEVPSITAEVTGAFPQFTNGIIGPLFPWLLDGYAELPPDQLFEKGKWFNLTLSCVLLVVFGITAARAFSFIGSAAIILMGGFGVILERSAYFSPDALFYLLFVLAWLCALSLIRQNLLWQYGVFGLLLGLGYLTKPLVWPLVLSFIAVSFIRSLVAGLTRREGRPVEDLWSPSNQLVGFAMMISAFVFLCGPNMSYSNARFGSPFHSYQSYQIWLDSSAEASRFQSAFPGREELSTLTLVERPGVVKYIQDNGVSALAKRGWEGAIEQVKSSVLGRKGWILSYGFFVFLVVAGIHRWTMIKQKEEVWRVRGTSARWMLLFTLIAVSCALFYSGVGNSIFPGSSITTALFLPVLLSFIWIAERYRRQLQRSNRAALVNWVYGALMAIPIVWITSLIVITINKASA